MIFHIAWRLFEFSFVCIRNVLSIPLAPQLNVHQHIVIRNCICIQLVLWRKWHKHLTPPLEEEADVSIYDLHDN